VLKYRHIGKYKHIRNYRSCIVGYNEFDFFKKMKNTNPVMDVKLKSKTHLQNTFFLFFEPFFARLASKIEKSANMT
jgi:hypothetical protein